MTRHIATLEEWEERKARQREGFFDEYPLRAMKKLGAGYYQFGYEIWGHGTRVGCNHQHRTKEGAEECGRRFLAGLPIHFPKWQFWRRNK